MLMLKPLHPELSPLSLNYFLVTWFHSGRVSPASGTWGSLAALPFCWLIRLEAGWQGLSFFIIALTGCALWAIRLYLIKVDHPDPAEVVIDEVLGMAVVCLMIPFSCYFWAAGFILFRFFDILKPGLIGWCDRRLKGALAIIADDALAGFAAGAVLCVVAKLVAI